MRKDRAHQQVGREAAEARFDRLYAEHGRAVLAYALRRTSEAQDAADVLAEVFLIAWRRLDELPPGEGGRLWVYGVARHVLANQRRSERRREQLTARLRRELPAAVQSMPPPALGAEVIRAALSQLGSEDQEVLRLAAWEELTPVEIATGGPARRAWSPKGHPAHARSRHTYSYGSENRIGRVPVLWPPVRERDGHGHTATTAARGG